MKGANSNRPWTPEEDARLRSLMDAGMSVGLVAAKFKRTTFAIKARATVLKVSIKRLPRKGPVNDISI